MALKVDHDSHYVGGASVIVAKDRRAARRLLHRKLSETGLLNGMLRDNNNAWERFMKEYKPLICATALNVLAGKKSASNEDVEDIYHTVLLALLENNKRALRKYSTAYGGSLRRWVFAITKNTSLKMMRDRSRHPIGYEVPKGMMDDTDPESTLANKEQVRLFIELFRGLSGREKRILRLSCEMSTKEVAVQMGISHGAMRSGKHRVCARLREQLSYERSGGNRS